MKPRIIFIHGMFLNDRSWEPWLKPFREAGYDCEAIPWPLHSGDPAELRRNPPPDLGDLTLGRVFDHFAKKIQGSAPPVLVGHSLGGLIVQKLVAADLALAGVCLCPVAPNRMLAADWGFFRNTVAITNPLAGDSIYTMTEEGFRKNFGNQMSEADSARAFEKYALHESRQVLRDIMGDEGKIDVERAHAPLLFIGAEKDEIIPAPLVRRNAHAYTHERSHSEYREFSNRGHFIYGENDWEEVAQSIAGWLQGHLTAVQS
jgi:pimeloyl-ACP methyl ester carboxylesterase